MRNQDQPGRLIASAFIMAGMKTSVTAPGSVPMKPSGATPMIPNDPPQCKDRPQDVGVASESTRPVVVTQDCHWMCAGCCIVIGHEQAAEGRFQPEHSKDVTRNILPLDPLRPDGGPNDRVPRCGDTDYHQIRAVGDYFPVPPERRVVELIAILRAAIAVEKLAVRKKRPSRSATGKVRNSTALMRRNAAVVAPIARASERIAAALTAGRLRSCRHPKTASDARIEPRQQLDVTALLVGEACCPRPSAPSAARPVRWPPRCATRTTAISRRVCSGERDC